MKPRYSGALPARLVLLILGLLLLLAVPTLQAQPGATEAGECADCEDAPAASATFLVEFVELQEQTLSEVLRVAGSVPQDRQTWKPSSSSSSVLEICNEVASLNYGLARFLARKRVGEGPATTLADCLGQVKAAFAAVEEGLEAFPDGKTAGDIQVDTSNLKVTMREFLMRYLSRNAWLLGKLEALAALASHGASGE